MGFNTIGSGVRSGKLSAAGDSAIFSLDDEQAARAKFTLQTVWTGGPTAVSVTLQGSLDGVHFYTLATSTSTTGDAQFVVDKPAVFLKVNLGTLTGGTTPSVVWLVAGQ